MPLRDRELRLVAAWQVWVVGWALASAVTYAKLRPPEAPLLHLEASATRFGPSRALALQFRLDQPAPVRIAVNYDLDQGTAKYRREFALKGSPRIAIPPGERQVTLELEQTTPPAPRRNETVRKVPLKVVAQLAPGEGYRMAGDSRLEIDLDADKIVRAGQPPDVTLNPDRTGFDDEHKSVTLRFRLNRPASYEVRGAFRTDEEGPDKARRGVDYRIFNPSGGNTDVVVFAPNQTEQSITVERLSGPGATTGKGDRLLTVSAVPGEDWRLGARDTVSINVPDPKARLTWAVSKDRVRRREEDVVYLKATLSRRLSEPVVLEYDAPVPQGLAVELPLVDPNGRRSITLKPGDLDGESNITFHKDDVVGGPPRTVTLRCTSVTPKDLGRPEEFRQLEITATDSDPLTGRVLVLVILDKNLKRDPADVVEELGEFVNRHPDDLVDGSLYVLAGDGKIHRWLPKARDFPDLEPLPEGVPFEKTLNMAVRAVADQFGSRIRDASHVTALVWQNPAGERGKRPDAAEVDFKGPPDDRWHLFWIGPEGTLADLLAARFPPVGGKRRFHRQDEARKPSLSGMLGQLVPPR
jgi:hypothetical protein